MLQLDPRIRRRKTPLDHRALSIAFQLPRSDFLASLLDIADASLQTLVNQNGYLDFHPLQPTPVERRVMPFDPFCQTECFWERKCFIQSSRSMRIQMIEDESHFGNRGIFLIQQVFEAIGNISCACMFLSTRACRRPVCGSNIRKVEHPPLRENFVSSRVGRAFFR